MTVQDVASVQSVCGDAGHKWATEAGLMHSKIFLWTEDQSA